MSALPLDPGKDNEDSDDVRVAKKDDVNNTTVKSIEDRWHFCLMLEPYTYIAERNRR